MCSLGLLLNIFRGYLSGFLYFRQKLVLIDVQKQVAEVPSKEFQKRGSLQYQFGSELLQLPVYLFKIQDVGSQVKLSHRENFGWRLESVNVGKNLSLMQLNLPIDRGKPARFSRDHI